MRTFIRILTILKIIPFIIILNLRVVNLICNNLLMLVLSLLILLLLWRLILWNCRIDLAGVIKKRKKNFSRKDMINKIIMLAILICSSHNILRVVLEYSFRWLVNLWFRGKVCKKGNKMLNKLTNNDYILP